MSEYNSTDRGTSTPPPDPFVALRAADSPGWTDPVAPDPEFARRLRDRRAPIRLSVRVASGSPIAYYLFYQE